MTMIGGSEPQGQQTYHSQVYLATHEKMANSEDYQRLDPRYRSFISFKYDGIDIEDFDLIAITENNAMQRPLYAEFEDQVTEYAAWDGQIYWSSHHKAKTMDFALFTDGIDEKMLGRFKHHFHRGKTAELILAEHPNRAILARVAKAPEMSMLPFSKEITVDNKQFETTNYKGRINLSFVMDDPFWYSIKQQFDSSELEELENQKIRYEDKVISASDLNFGDGLSSFTSYYYGGDAPCYPTVHFTIPLSRFAVNTQYYIRLQRNDSDILSNSVLILKAPSIVRAIYDCGQCNTAQQVRDNVKHRVVRAAYATGSVPTISSWTLDGTINCRTGETEGKYYYGNVLQLTESIGDMIVFNNLKFDNNLNFKDIAQYDQWTYYELTSNLNTSSLYLTYKYLYY